MEDIDKIWQSDLSNSDAISEIKKLFESLTKENEELREEKENLTKIVTSVVVSLKENGLESFAELVESKITPKT